MKSLFNKIFMGMTMVCLSIGAVSCDDMLDLKPQGQITEE